MKNLFNFSIFLSAVFQFSNLSLGEEFKEVGKIKQSIADEPFTLKPEKGGEVSATLNVKGSHVSISDAYWGVTQLLYWNDLKTLRLLWWESKDPAIRCFIVAMIFIAANDDETERILQEFLESALRFNKNESVKRNDEIIDGLKMSKRIAQILLANSLFDHDSKIPACIEQQLKTAEKRFLEKLIEKIDKTHD